MLRLSTSFFVFLLSPVAFHGFLRLALDFTSLLNETVLLPPTAKPQPRVGQDGGDQENERAKVELVYGGQ